MPPPPPPLTLLFDLDGTLVVADHLHHAAFNAILQPFGRRLTFDEYKVQIMGLANDAIMREQFPGLPVERHRALADEKEKRFRESAAGLAPARGTVRLLDWAAARGVPSAVVTNAPRANAELMLAGAGIADRFAAVVVAEELARGKPDPLPYLEGLRRLGGEAERAVAFEDSAGGLQAARAAGLLTFGLRTGLDEAALRGAGADEVIDDFEAPVLWETLARLLP